MYTKTYTAAEAAEELGLPYGRNTFYKELRNLGFLDANNYPDQFMLDCELMIVRRPIIKGILVKTIPIFTERFLSFFKMYLS
jgi:hypothetical protein